MKRERNIFAVCDLEVEYAYHFMEYLSKKKNIPFEIRVFTSVDTLLGFVKEQEIELLLISEKAMCQEIQEEKIGQIMILSEGVSGIYSEAYPSIYKYQSSNQVIREALTCYGEGKKEMEKLPAVQKKQVEILGVYSPVGRTMKTTFALTMGQILAKRKAVLYMNLEEYSGFEYLLEQTYEQTMGDLLYYLRQKTPNWIMRMSGMIQTMNNLDFLPPVFTPGDIQSTTLEEWIELLQGIIDYSNYDIILLDLGDGVSGLYRFLDQCTKIYMPVRNDPVSQAKITQFETILRTLNQGEVLGKIQKLKLPYHRTTHKGVNYLDDLVWSELGDYVRELIRKEGAVLQQEKKGKGNEEWMEDSLQTSDRNL